MVLGLGKSASVFHPPSQKNPPPRPVAGSIVDFLEARKGLFLSSCVVCWLTCSFLSRISSSGLGGSGLGDRPRSRRADVSDRKYVYIEDGKENFTDAPPAKPSREKNPVFFRSVIQAVQRSTGGSLRRSASPSLPHVLGQTCNRQTVFGAVFLLVMYTDPGPSPPSQST